MFCIYYPREFKEKLFCNVLYVPNETINRGKGTLTAVYVELGRGLILYSRNTPLHVGSVLYGKGR